MVAVQTPVQFPNRAVKALLAALQVSDTLIGTRGGVNVKTPIPVVGDGGRTAIAAAKVGSDAVARPIGISVNSFRESANRDQKNHKDNA